MEQKAFMGCRLKSSVAVTDWAPVERKFENRLSDFAARRLKRVRLHTKCWILDDWTGHGEDEELSPPHAVLSVKITFLPLHAPPTPFSHILPLRQSPLLLVGLCSSCRSVFWQEWVMNNLLWRYPRQRNVCFIYVHIFVLQKRSAELPFMDFRQQEIH